MPHHLVRVGAMGLVGRFRAAEGMIYPRGERVVVRTVRGIEVAEVLDPPVDWRADGEPDGELLRRMTIEDELLAERLSRRRQDALDSCQQMLDEKQLAVTLLDVEHLLDGQGVYFYFLGEVPPEVEACTEQLAATYESTVKFQQFADTLLEGCGPGCGTEQGAGQGCSTCSTCAVAGACKSR